MGGCLAAWGGGTAAAARDRWRQLIVLGRWLGGREDGWLAGWLAGWVDEWACGGGGSQ